MYAKEKHTNNNNIKKVKQNRRKQACKTLLITRGETNRSGRLEFIPLTSSVKL